MSRLVKQLVLMMVSAVPLAAQQTWLVGCGVGGPPVHFTDLSAAVAAASPGDTIRIIGDNTTTSPCMFFSPASIDKPLTIVGMSGSGIPQTWQDVMTIRGLLQISNLAVGERVVLRGLFFYSPNVIFASGPPFGIEAMNCAGEIVLDQVGVWSDGNGGATASFVNCDHVAIHDSEFVMGERPVEVTNSSMLFTNSLVRHSAPVGISILPFLNNSVGMHIDHATVTLTTSLVRGASSYNLFPGNWPTRPAVSMDHGVLEVGPGSVITSGDPPFGSYYAVAGGGSAVYLDPRALIVNPGNPQPITKNLDATMYNVAAPGESFDYVLAGPAYGFALMVLGHYRKPVASTPIGDWWLDPATLFVAAFAPLNSVGEYSGSLSVPPGVGSATVFGLQSLTLSPNGDLGLTLPTPLLLGWESSLSPY